VVLFFQFLKYMSWIFFFLTLLSIPQMILSVSYNTNLKDRNYKGTIRLLSLGNFETQRYPTPACGKTLFRGDAAVYELRCGDEVLGELTDFG